MNCCFVHDICIYVLTCVARDDACSNYMEMIGQPFSKWSSCRLEHCPSKAGGHCLLCCSVLRVIDHTHVTATLSQETFVSVARHSHKQISLPNHKQDAALFDNEPQFICLFHGPTQGSCRSSSSAHATSGITMPQCEALRSFVGAYRSSRVWAVSILISSQRCDADFSARSGSVCASGFLGNRGQRHDVRQRAWRGGGHGREGVLRRRARQTSLELVQAVHAVRTQDPQKALKVDLLLVCTRHLPVAQPSLLNSSQGLDQSGVPDVTAL